MGSLAPKNNHIGFCIYCGSKKELSEEHIIPFGLNGELTLKDASCESCREITNLFEAPVLRGIFYDYRFLKGHQSRTKLKDFDPVSEYLIKTKDGKKERRMLHLNQVGIHFFLPEFQEPRYITNTKGRGVLLKRFVTYRANPRSHNIPSDLDSVKIERKIPTSHLVRLLCKIGLGYVYLEDKDKGFKSYVTNLVLGKSGAKDWKYVGSPKKSKFKDNERGVKIFQQDKLLLCEIKLFGDVLARYLVVLGEVY